MNAFNISGWLGVLSPATTSEPPTPLALASQDRGDGEKVLAMLVLGLGSFIAGMLPAIISERNRRRFPLTTSLLLCFGAGILLATALVHILPEVRQQMASNYAEIALCGGFFIIYFIDEFIHYFFGEAIQHSHATTPSQQPQSANVGSSNPNDVNSRRNYGTLSTAAAANSDEHAPLLQAAQNSSSHSQPHLPVVVSNGRGGGDVAESCDHAHLHSHCDDEAVAAANARICHTSHTEPCAQTMTGTLGLFVALSLHSAIEGLAIGVQNSASKVLFLLGAVACHKFVMGFCLGLEFRSNPRATMRAQLIGISIFALGAICGIGLGMLVVDVPTNWTTSALPVIQALAGGTLFYVCVCEVIPREKARWHQNTTRKAAGFAQFAAVFCGFAAMTLVNSFLDDDA